MLESLLDTPASRVLPPGHPPKKEGLGKVDSALGREAVSLTPGPMRAAAQLCVCQASPHHSCVL